MFHNIQYILCIIFIFKIALKTATKLIAIHTEAHLGQKITSKVFNLFKYKFFI